LRIRTLASFGRDKIADRLARNVHPNKDAVEELIALARERFERKPSPPNWKSAEALRDEIKRSIDRIERRLEPHLAA
jgi:hypothetical protein